MTRAEAAEFVGVSVSTISRWETSGVKNWGQKIVLRDRTEKGLVNFVRATARINKHINPAVLARAFPLELLMLKAADRA